MKEYDQLKAKYAFPATSHLTDAYLDSFYLSNADYQRQYLSIQERVFCKPNLTEDDCIFFPSFKTYQYGASLVFTRKKYELLQKLLSQTTDSSILLIEDDATLPSAHLIKLIINKNCNWINLSVKDEGICYEVFGRPVRNYFVYGNSGTWGMYNANDWRHEKCFWGFDERFPSDLVDDFIKDLGGFYGV